MEGQAVVKALLDQLFEILTGDGGNFLVQLDVDDAAVFHSNANHNATILLLCCPAAVRECSAEGLPDISYSIP